MPSFPEGHAPKWWKRNPESLAVARAEEDRRKLTAKPQREPESSQSRNLVYLRSTGFVSLVLAIGAILMDYYFWWFVTFTCIGISLAFADCFLEKPLGKFRYAVCSFFAVALIGFLAGFVWGRTKPLFDAAWNPGNYAEGTDIHGIEWKDRYSELRITISNNNDIDLNDFDMAFRIGEPVAKIKQIDNLPCSLLQNEGSILDIRGNDADGHATPMAMDATEGTYRLVCGKIPPHIGVSLVVALMSHSSIIEADPAKFSKHKEVPDWVRYKASYKANKRPYSIEGTMPLSTN
jgi:hypothetical protein